MSNTTGTLSNINFMSMEKYNSLQTVSENELYAVRVNPYSSEPQNITVLADGNYTTVGTSTVFTLSEPFTNFEELVTIGSFSGSSKTRGTAYRISTYWLNYLLTEMNSVDIWGSCAGDYAAIGGYNNSSKPSTTTSFAIASSTYAQIGKIYGVNRKAS